mmetsp:Transcript_2925/g.3451  ORF Transcript_2925/g.3451 Transcript_2925/m.3451 type:complete len:463 (+) Transcript_2925:99-1487(+)
MESSNVVQMPEQNSNDDTVLALKTACVLKSSSDSQILIEAPTVVDSDIAEIHKISEILFLASIGNLDRLKKSISNYNIDICTPKFRDYDKRTALHVAAACGCYAVSEWLLQQGVNKDAIDAFSLTPLASAARNRQVEVVKLLQDYGAKVCNAEGEYVFLKDSPLQEIVEPRLGYDIGEEWEIGADSVKQVKVIGKGQFGEVYLANWRGAQVVAKCLKEVNLSNETAMAEFRAEIELQRSLHHPNITQFFGVVLGPPIWLVVEYLEGDTLASMFRKPLPKGYSFKRACSLCLDVCKGLYYLHSLKPKAVIHRDLKPANLLLDKSGRCKIADFGLSKTLNKDATNFDAFTMTGETGTYRYMAPEVFRHRPYGTPVDIYSFSMVVYQCFAWAKPFHGLSGVDACRRALEGKRPNLQNLPNDLQEILRKCWTEKPEERMTAREALEALEKFQSSLRLKKSTRCSIF